MVQQANVPKNRDIFTRIQDHDDLVEDLRSAVDGQVLTAGDDAWEVRLLGQGKRHATCRAHVAHEQHPLCRRRAKICEDLLRTNRHRAVLERHVEMGVDKARQGEAPG